MYNYTYEGISGYVQAKTEKELIQASNKKGFNAFEWEIARYDNGFIYNKVRMISIDGKDIKAQATWNQG
jgi:flagellar motor component MotA